MKWFKHETDAESSEKLSIIVEEFGFAGYGRFWRIMEIVAAKMDKTNRCSVKYTEKKWGTLLKYQHKAMAMFMERLGDVGLMCVERDGNVITISVPNLLKKRDNHTSNLQVTCKQEVEVEVEVEVDKETPKEAVSVKPRLSFGPSATDSMHAEKMQEHIVQVVPDFRTTNGNSVEEWAEQILEMRAYDKRSYADIADMWEFARGHKWWRSRILSPASLRKHWNTLSAQKNNPDEEVKPQWIIDKENAAAKHEEEMLAIERRAFEKVEAKCR